MNRTKWSLLVVTFSMAAAVVFAEDKKQREVDKILQRFQSQLRDATQPVYTQAIESLEAVKKGAMTDGDLPAANEIQKNIDQLTIAKTRDNLSNRVFAFYRTIPGVPHLKFLPSGRIDGNDHPFETAWEITSDARLVIKGADGQIMSTYDPLPSKNGMLRFNGTPKGGTKDVLQLQEVLK